MLYVTVVLCSAACAVAAPAATDVVPLEKQQPTVIPIVSQSEELEPNGTYKFSYETGNGIKREEISYDKKNPKAKGRSADSNEGGERDGSSSSEESDEIHVQQGSYSYTAPDGTLISVRYIADENGFQPIGDHIPRIGGPSPASANSERSSKKLKDSDNAESESAPVSAARSAGKAKKSDESIEPKIGTSDDKASKESHPAEEPTEALKELNPAEEPIEASKESNTTEVPAEASTTEAASLSDASSTEAGKVTNIQDSTTEALTTTAKALESTEPSTTGVPKEFSESPSTEAASTAASEPTSISESSSSEASATVASS